MQPRRLLQGFQRPFSAERDLQGLGFGSDSAGSVVVGSLFMWPTRALCYITIQSKPSISSLLYPFHPHLFNLYLLPPLPTLQRGRISDDGIMDVVLSRLSTQLLSPLSTDELLFREPPAFLSRYVTYLSCILLSGVHRRVLLVSCLIDSSSPCRY